MSNVQLTERIILAVAAENENKSDDDDPDAVVIKEIAQAVIHSESSLQSFEGLFFVPFDIIL